MQRSGEKLDRCAGQVASRVDESLNRDGCAVCEVDSPL